MLITQGKMQYLYDHTGRRYLDAWAGICTVGVGHCNPYVNRKLKEQIDKGWHFTHMFANPAHVEYSARLLSKLPKKLSKVYFVNSGSEANDTASMMVQAYTGRQEILCLKNGFHGATPNAAQMTGLRSWTYPQLASSKYRHVSNADPYRGLFGGSRSGLAKTIHSINCPNPKNAGKMYAQDIQEAIDFSTAGEIGGFWAEGIQGVGGTVQYAEGYIDEAFKLVRKNGGVCVMDEVQTGFGRLGDNFWGWQDHVTEENCPDVLIVAKSMGNGFPMAAVITTEDIANSIKTRVTNCTFGGNALAMSVGSSVLDYLEEHNVQANCKKIGKIMMDGLHEIQEKYEVIGDVRGKGMMLGVEFVKDRDTKEPDTETLNVLHEMMKEEGVIVGKGGLWGNTMRIKPPMIWTPEDAKFFLGVMDYCLEKMQD